jgi:hypothetical protein
VYQSPLYSVECSIRSQVEQSNGIPFSGCSTSELRETISVAFDRLQASQSMVAGTGSVFIISMFDPADSTYAMASELAYPKAQCICAGVNFVRHLAALCFIPNDLRVLHSESS